MLSETLKIKKNMWAISGNFNIMVFLLNFLILNYDVVWLCDHT